MVTLGDKVPTSIQHSTFSESNWTTLSHADIGDKLSKKKVRRKSHANSAYNDMKKKKHNDHSRREKMEKSIIHGQSYYDVESLENIHTILTTDDTFNTLDKVLSPKQPQKPSDLPSSETTKMQPIYENSDMRWEVLIHVEIDAAKQTSGLLNAVLEGTTHATTRMVY